MRWPWSRRAVQCRAVVTAQSVARVGERVPFSASMSVGDIINWRWEFDSGVTAWAQPDAVYVYEEAGIRYVSLVVIGPTGLVSEVSHIINILPRSSP